jgi:hypothetical protein
MEQNARERQRKGYAMMRSVYDFGLGIFIFGIGFILIFGAKLGIPALKEFIEGSNDPFLLEIFGFMSLLYGGFRLYRGIKKNY